MSELRFNPLPRRMACDRNPPPGPHVPAACGLLPAVSDKAGRTSDRGSRANVRPCRVRESFPEFEK
jgi:hypothetical protein